jgi:hypothetical protein
VFVERGDVPILFAVIFMAKIKKKYRWATKLGTQTNYKFIYKFCMGYVSHVNSYKLCPIRNFCVIAEKV